MALEKPSIKEVKSNVVRIAHPYLSGNKTTYLTAELDATGIAITVKDNTDFADDDYIILGEVGGQMTEIVKVNAAVTPGTAMTTTACVFDHPIGEKVTYIRYNQLQLYGSATTGDTSPSAIGSLVGIDVKSNYTEILVDTADIESYYYVRYYNEDATEYSSYSESASAGGLSNQARGEIKNEFLSIYNEKIDDLITDDWLNRSINRWQRELSKRRNQWSVLRYTDIIETTQDTQAYSLPSDIQDENTEEAIVSVKYYNEPEIKYADEELFQKLTFDHIGSTLYTDIGLADITVVLDNTNDFADSGTIYVEGDEIAYTANTRSTNTLSGVTGITATHTADDEVWQVRNTGSPVRFTIDSDYIKLYPMPGSVEADKNLYLEYWRKFTDLDDDQDETLFKYPENCYLYLNWQVAIRRKLSEDIIMARKAQWQIDLEQLVAEDPDFREIRIQPMNFYKTNNSNFYSSNRYV